MNKRLTFPIMLLIGLLLGSTGIPASASVKTTTKTVPTILRGYYKHGNSKIVHLTRHYLDVGPFGKGYLHLKISRVKRVGTTYALKAPKFSPKAIKIKRLSHKQLQFYGKFLLKSQKKTVTRTTKATFNKVLNNEF